MQPPNRQELTKINKQLGKKIQDARSLAGFSRTELANLIGISVQWMKCLELGIDVEQLATEILRRDSPDGRRQVVRRMRPKEI